MNLILALIFSSTLWGEWKYSGYTYEGHDYPLPNDNLYLSFTFQDYGVVRLYWKRADENYFCERLAYFRYENDILRQEIFWVNPKNGSLCGADPDMQMGRITENRLIIEPDQKRLHIVLELNGKDFLYTLTKLENLPGK